MASIIIDKISVIILHSNKRVIDIMALSFGIIFQTVSFLKMFLKFFTYISLSSLSF